MLGSLKIYKGWSALLALVAAQVVSCVFAGYAVLHADRVVQGPLSWSVLGCICVTLVVDVLLRNRAKDVGLSFSANLIGNWKNNAYGLNIANYAKYLPVALLDYARGVVMLAVSVKVFSGASKIYTAMMALLMCSCLVWRVTNCFLKDWILYKNSTSAIVAQSGTLKGDSIYRNWLNNNNIGAGFDAANRIASVSLIYLIVSVCVRMAALNLSFGAVIEFLVGVIISSLSLFDVVFAVGFFTSFAISVSLKQKTLAFDDHCISAQPMFRVQNLSFSQNDKKILNNLNLTVKSGYKLGVVTTDPKVSYVLAEILSGRLSCDEGEMFLDDSVVNSECLNKNAALISENLNWSSVLTIKVNLFAGDNRSAFTDVLKISMLYDFIQGLDNRENGFLSIKTLTPYRRKCLSLARSILLDPKLVILEELDFHAPTKQEEKALRLTTRQFLNYRTSIIITTNPTLVADMDSIVIIDNGSVVEAGDHLSLINNGGVYANLYIRYFNGTNNIQ